MSIDYKTPGTKEYKKFALLKDLIMDLDPTVRKKAIALYNKVTKSEYDSVIEQLSSEVDKIETVYRKAEKKILLDARKAEQKGQEPAPASTKKLMDKSTEMQLDSIKFKLKYYNELKDIEINTKIKKAKLDFYEEDYF